MRPKPRKAYRKLIRRLSDIIQDYFANIDTSDNGDFWLDLYVAWEHTIDELLEEKERERETILDITVRIFHWLVPSINFYISCVDRNTAWSPVMPTKEELVIALPSSNSGNATSASVSARQAYY